jgi:hypothetical protein
MNGKTGHLKIEVIVRSRNQHCYCHRTPKPFYTLDWFCQRTGGLIIAGCSGGNYTYPVRLEGMYYCYSHTYTGY